MADYQGALTGQQIDALPGKIEALEEEKVISVTNGLTIQRRVSQPGITISGEELQNSIGNLSALQTTTKTSLVAAVNEVKNNSGGGDSDEIGRLVEAMADMDSDRLPLLCGQPQKLFGAGTPQEAIVPDNWRQFDPETEEGYNWNGVPTAIGQEYINTAVSSGGRYIAVRDGNYSLKWVNS